jgi:hypothetical protein
MKAEETAIVLIEFQVANPIWHLVMFINLLSFLH